MGFAAVLLDKYKKTTGTPSDRALAHIFDVSPQTVSQWRAGTAWPEEEKIAALAVGAKDEPGGWLNAIRAERCTGPAALAYRKIARSFGIAATILLAVYTAMPANAIQVSNYFTNSDALGIAHQIDRMARRLLAFLQEVFGGVRHGQAALC